MYESVPMLLPIVCLWKINIIVIIYYEWTDTLVLYEYYI
jgi:hypothetical protein